MQSYVVRNLRNATVLVTLGAIACNPVDAGSVDFGPAPTVHTTTAPIIGGEDSPATENGVVQVMLIIDGEIDVGRGATGTLVAPNLVLTARHVIAPELQAEESRDCRPGEPEVLFGPNYPPDQLGVFVDRVNRRLTTSTAGMYAVKEIFVGPSTKICDSDLAFLILERPVPDVEPFALRLSGPPSQFETVSIIGFGSASTSYDFPKVRQRVDGLKINRYVPLNGPQSDMGEGTGTVSINVLDRAPCKGDSGGPVLSANRAILGVHSASFRTGEVPAYDPSNPLGFCLNSTAVGNTVYDRKEFVDSAFAKAGYTYIEEGQGIQPEAGAAAGTPLGGSCERGPDCASGQCVDVGGARACTTDCTNAPCPDGFWCSSVGEASKLCVRQSQPSDGGTGCSIEHSNLPGQGHYATVVLVVGLACMRRRRRSLATS